MTKYFFVLKNLWGLGIEKVAPTPRVFFFTPRQCQTSCIMYQFLTDSDKPHVSCINFWPTGAKPHVSCITFPCIIFYWAEPHVSCINLVMYHFFHVSSWCIISHVSFSCIIFIYHFHVSFSCITCIITDHVLFFIYSCIIFYVPFSSNFITKWNMKSETKKMIHGNWTTRAKPHVSCINTDHVSFFYYFMYHLHLSISCIIFMYHFHGNLKLKSVNPKILEKIF